MKVKERGSWVAFNEGKGGKKQSFDQFNKAFKGQERNPKVNEFASQGLEEYHHYSERAEVKEKDEDSKSKQQETKKQNPSTNIVKNVVGKVVAVGVGAVVVVTTYQTIIENEKQPDPEPTPIIEEITDVNWNWSADFKDVTVEFINADGKTIKEASAVVVTIKVNPTCTIDGSITYTATVTENSKEYSDTKKEVIKALGHDMGSVEHIDHGDGTSEYKSICSRCGEEFSIIIGEKEE